jgi:glycosyltransferase involved in cell wall biosynthesis
MGSRGAVPAENDDRIQCPSVREVIAVQRQRGAVDTELDVTLDRPLRSAVPAGRPTAVFCVGTCFHRHRRVVDMAITVDGVRHRPIAQRMPRLDRFRALHPTLASGDASVAAVDPESPRDPELRSYRSGFWATIPIDSQRPRRELELHVEARLADGTMSSAPLGTIDVVEPFEPPSFGTLARAGRQPLIAICMATFNPEAGLFPAQVESIRGQSDTDWICLVSDDCSAPDRFQAITEVLDGDERFVLSRSAEHLGFYRNFERALQMVPREAEFVALSDHDDRWYPDKLEALRAAIGDAEFVYSDARRVDADGRVKGETLWRGRRNNPTNLASLLISNTIVGASCLFRRRVIDQALPFPDGPGWDFHDHWLALVGMALGNVAYVDRPLYDYVQHAGAVLGRTASEPGREPRPVLGARLRQRRRFLGRWRSAYFTIYLQRKLQAQVLLGRCAAALSRRKRRALRLLVAAERSPLAFAWLALRPARALLGRNETLQFEAVLAKGILWRHAIALTTRGRERPGASTDDVSAPSFEPQRFGDKRRRWLAQR